MRNGDRTLRALLMVRRDAQDAASFEFQRARDRGDDARRRHRAATARRDRLRARAARGLTGEGAAFSIAEAQRSARFHQALRAEIEAAEGAHDEAAVALSDAARDEEAARRALAEARAAVRAVEVRLDASRAAMRESEEARAEDESDERVSERVARRIRNPV